MVYLAAVCILHDEAQAVVCLEGVFQSLKAEKAELSDICSVFNREVAPGADWSMKHGELCNFYPPASCSKNGFFTSGG